MLKKLLPELKKLILSLRKSRPNQPEQKPPSNTNSFDINLLDSVLIRDETKKISPNLIKTTHSTVLITFIIFLTFFIVNSILDLKLSELMQKRNDLLSYVESKKDLEKNISNISRLINIYKDKKTSIRKSSNDLEQIIPAINKNSDLVSMKYTSSEKVYKINLNSKKVINYAFLINDLLSNPIVDSIVLNNVDYVS